MAVAIKEELLGIPSFNTISYIESPLPKGFLQYETEVWQYWKEYQVSHPRAIPGPKIRINKIECTPEKELIIHGSEGVTYAHLVWMKLLSELGLMQSAQSPQLSYTWNERGDSAVIMDLASNLAAVAAIPILKSEKGLVVLFTIRSQSVSTNAGTLSLLVNGYVDPLPQSNNLLLDNLYKETEEEALITKGEIDSVSPVGLCQFGGLSCDITWIARSSLPLEVWANRWKTNKGEYESRGVIPIRIKDLGALFDEAPLKGRGDILADSLLPFALQERINQEGAVLNPLIEALKRPLIKLSRV